MKLFAWWGCICSNCEQSEKQIWSALCSFQIIIIIIIMHENYYRGI